jgi:tRNA-splicing ligase RtcB
MKIIDNITVFGELEERLDLEYTDVFAQIKQSASPEGALGILCADNHLGYRMPIGGVVAYPDHISPSGVGYDIGCGNNAVRTNLKLHEIGNDMRRIVEEIAAQIEFGLGSKGNEERRAVFDNSSWKSNPLLNGLDDLAASQLGSVGGGNHYIDILRDEDNCIWVANHFGSRGFGHTVAKRTLTELGMKDVVNGEPALIKEGTELFDDYLEAMKMAGNYAALGRSIVIDKVIGILGAQVDRHVDNHHNFAWREEHNGQKYWVVRKGSTPLRPDQLSFIGGSMGDVSVIVRGVDGPEARQALYSAPHGAGRVISRSKAKKTFTYEQMREVLEKYNVIVIGGDLDESPMAYRDLSGVMDAHFGAFEMAHILYPVGVVMAGKNIHDPYKD